jgi:hypothetical protein
MRFVSAWCYSRGSLNTVRPIPERCDRCKIEAMWQDDSMKTVRCAKDDAPGRNVIPQFSLVRLSAEGGVVRLDRSGTAWS